MICPRCEEDKDAKEFKPGYIDKGDNDLCRHCRRNTRIIAWAKANKHKRACHVQVSFALKRGDLKRASKCERCGTETYTVAHHPDYSKPLFVEWLCDSCHTKQTRADNPNSFKCGPRLPVYRPSV